LKAAAISPTKRKPSQTSIVMERRSRAATVLAVIVRLEEIVAGAVDVPVVADVIADAAGAVDVLVVADGIAVDAAARAGEGTKNLLPRIGTDSHGHKKGHGESRGLFSCRSKLPLESKEPKSRCEHAQWLQA
jgi:hypothetical protein